jgi:hypothetical protein
MEKRKWSVIYLEGAESKDGDADVAVVGVRDALGLLAEVDAGGPAGDANAVADQLAGDVEVEPRGVRRLERLEVPREDGARGQQHAPAHGVQDSMDLSRPKTTENELAGEVLACVSCTKECENEVVREMEDTHIAFLGGAVGSGGGGGGPEQVQLGLGGEVVRPHSVRRGGPAGDGGADLPHLVQDARAVGSQPQPPVDPGAAVGAELGGEVGRRERYGPGVPERVPGHVVRADGPRGCGAAAVVGERPRDERLRARHAVARRVERPRHPAARRGGRGDEGHGEVPRRAVVGPVHGRAEAGQVAAGRVRAVRREGLARAPPAPRRVRRRRSRQKRENERDGGAGHG